MSNKKAKFDLLLKRLDKVGIPKMDFDEFMSEVRERAGVKDQQPQPVKNDNKDLLKQFHLETQQLKQQIALLENKINIMQNDNKILNAKINENSDKDLVNEKKLNIVVEELKLDASNKILKLKEELKIQQTQQKRSITPVSRLNLNRTTTIKK